MNPPPSPSGGRRRSITASSYNTGRISVSRLPASSHQSVYDVFRLFFDAFDLFLEIFGKYEERVNLYCSRHRCDRTSLIDRLSSEEISGLFEFEELVRLRLEFLRGFQEFTPDSFLGRDSMAVKGFLLHTRHLYHLVSMLTLEELTVSVIAPGYVDLSEDENFREIIREVDREFPAKLREIRSKFEQSIANLNSILPHYRYDHILLRSIFLFERERIVRYYGSLDHFYLLLYPTGVLGGLRMVTESFFESGFLARAAEAMDLLVEEIERRGEETFDRREGADAEWHRYRRLRLQMSPESDGTVLV